MKKTKFPGTLNRTLLAVPAAALMLGAAEAGTTVGLNFQTWYYESGASPQTIGFNNGYSDYNATGFPVTAKAFGVEVANWSNTNPLGSLYNSDPISNQVCTFGVGAATTFAGGLSCTVNAPKGAHSSGSGGLIPLSNQYNYPTDYPTTLWTPPGETEVFWGNIMADDANPFTVSVTGLAAKFPNGYVIQTLAGLGANGGYEFPLLPSADFTDGATTTTATYHIRYVQNDPGCQWTVSTVGISDASPLFTGNTLTINSRADGTGVKSALAGIIITDKPVVSVPPKNTTVLSGNTLTLTAGAVGLPPITYQWRKNGTPISGETAATFTKVAAISGDSGSYDVIATNAYGSGTSSAAAVTVAVPATLTWDANTGTSGAQDGSGTWNTSNTNWWNGTADVAWSNLNYSVFGAGGAGPNTVTLGSDIDTSALTFNGGDYTLTNAASETLTVGTGGITTSGNATISVPLVGSTALTKSGAGTLTLTTRGTLTGPINVQQGTLNFPNSPPGYWYQWLLNTSVINLSPGTSLTCDGGAFGWYGTNNASGLTININGATCQGNGAFGIGYVLTGGTINGANRLDMGRSGGFNSFISSKASSTTSVVNPGGGILFRPDAATGDITQPSWTFTTEVGTTPSGIDLDIQASISQNGGSCPVIKNGPGTLKLSANNSYTGGTTVNAGTLIIAGTTNGTCTINGGSLVVSGQVSGNTTVNAGSLVVSGQISGITTVNAGSLVVTGKIAAGGSAIWLKDDTSLTVTASSSGSPAIATTGSFNVGTDFQNPAGMNTLNFAGLNSTTVAPITAGNLFLDSPVTVNILSLVPAIGQYPLMKRTSTVSVYDLTLGTLPSGVTATLVDDTNGPTGTVYLDVTGVVVNSLLWTGATNGNWDISTTSNWDVSGAPATFLQGDITSFDDSAISTTVTLTTTVNPASLTFSNVTKNYTLNGSGSISGFTGLTKTGAGALTLLTDNTNTGAINISGGGSVTVGNGGTTGLLGGTGSINLTGSTLTFNRSDDQALTRAIIGTGGTLVKTGGGTLTMNAPGNTCDITVNGGTLVAGGGGFSSGFAAGKLITLNNASLYNPGFHSMGSSVGGGGDVPVIVLNNSSWLLNHEQYIRTLTMNASSTSNTPGNEGLRTLSGSVYTVVAASTSSTIGSALNLVNPVTIDVADGAAANDLVISGPISNTGTLTKTGAGTMILTGANTYTGATSVNGGTLIVSGTSIPNTNKLTVNGGQVKSTGTEVVDTLFFGSIQQASGTWGASSSGATHIDNVHFTGTSGVVSVTSGPDFAAWALANAPGQTAAQDHDNDGVSNGIEYFMGLSGSGFTANPGVVTGKVSWPKGGSYTGVYGTNYTVQTSPDLSTWTDVLITDPNLSNGSPLEYTLPTGDTQIFSRLKVTGP